MIRAWRSLHALPAWLRWPLKLAALLGVTLLVLYPRPWLFVRLLERARSLDRLVDPDHPGLEPLVHAVRERAAPDAGPADLLPVVERVVYENVPYAWDWDNWGVMEYLPTTAEVLERRREDCDGRAVLAAAILRRMGCDAWLVSDLVHMWVETHAGETMSPTPGYKSISTIERPAPFAEAAPGFVGNLSRGLAFGVAVFPLGREIVLLVALVAVTLHPWSTPARRAIGTALLLAGLLLLRTTGVSAATRPDAGAVIGAWAAVAMIVAGWVVLAIRAGRRARRSPPAPHG